MYEDKINNQRNIMTKRNSFFQIGQRDQPRQAKNGKCL